MVFAPLSFSRSSLSFSTLSLLFNPTANHTAAMASKACCFHFFYWIVLLRKQRQGPAPAEARDPAVARD